MYELVFRFTKMLRPRLAMEFVQKRLGTRTETSKKITNDEWDSDDYFTLSLSVRNLKASP